MTNKSDWQAARDAMLADDRARLGEPPTAEKLLAYERGELPEKEAERIQQLLVAYPELARAFATAFPDEEVELPAEVIERQWNAFRGAETRPENGRVLLFWRAAAGLAAAAAIAFAVMLWQTRSAMLRPHVIPEATILTPDGVRGIGTGPKYAVTPGSASVHLVVSLIGPTDYERYRLELINSDSQARIWTSAPLEATNSNSFDVEVPTRALPPGTYRITAYGLRGTAEELVATYTIAVRGGK